MIGLQNSPRVHREGGHCCQIAENSAKSSNITVEKNYLQQEIRAEL
jgi:hypothetical protein